MEIMARVCTAQFLSAVRAFDCVDTRNIAILESQLPDMYPPPHITTRRQSRGRKNVKERVGERERQLLREKEEVAAGRRVGNPTGTEPTVSLSLSSRISRILNGKRGQHRWDR